MSQKHPHKANNRSNRPALTPLQRLKQAPRQPGRTLMGTLRQIDEPIEFEDAMFEPAIVLFVDAHTGQTKGATVFDPEDEEIEDPYDIAVQALIEGLLNPPEEPLGTFEHLLPEAGPPPRGAWLPGRLVVDDPELAKHLRTALASLSIVIEENESLPLMDEAFDALLEEMGIGAESESGPFEWDVDEQLLPTLYAASRAFWDEQPWRLVPNDPPLTVHLGANGPQAGTETVFASILGERGTIQGVASFYSLEDFRAAQEAGQEIAQLSDAEIDEALTMISKQGIANVDEMPRDMLRPLLRDLAGDQSGAVGALTRDALVCTFEEQEEVDETYLDWLEEHAIAPTDDVAVPLFMRAVPDEDPMPPTDQETIAQMHILQALTAFFREHRLPLETGSSLNAAISTTWNTPKGAITIAYTPQRMVDATLLNGHNGQIPHD